jgi:hypothetical protein
MYLSILNTNYNKSKTKIALNGKKMNSFPVKSGKHKGVCSPQYYSPYCWKSYTEQQVSINKLKNTDRKV